MHAKGHIAGGVWVTHNTKYAKNNRRLFAGKVYYHICKSFRQKLLLIDHIWMPCSVDSKSALFKLFNELNILNIKWIINYFKILNRNNLRS